MYIFKYLFLSLFGGGGKESNKTTGIAITEL